MDCPVWHSPHPKSLGWCVSCGWRAPETPPRNLAADLDALTQRVAALEAAQTPKADPPADSRLRELAEAVVAEWQSGAIVTGLRTLAAYLRETAR